MWGCVEIVPNQELFVPKTELFVPKGLSFRNNVHYLAVVVF